jgi:hypothetical protein
MTIFHVSRGVPGLSGKCNRNHQASANMGKIRGQLNLKAMPAYSHPSKTNADFGLRIEKAKNHLRHGGAACVAGGACSIAD